jgi:choline-sulfatase
LEGQPDLWSPFDPKFGGFWEGGRHWSEVLADDAVVFLQDAAKQAQDDDSKPFFMYLSFNAPHDPRQSPREFIDRYPLQRIKLPQPFLSRHPHDTAGLTPTRRDESLAPYPRTRYAIKVHRQEYYALISHMDQQIGRILTALESQQLNRDTWIIFTADHGLSCGHHGLMGKQNMYDHSVRVPFVIVGPGATPGTRIHEPILVQDLMATCLELAGDSRRDDVEFQSLLPLLSGGKSGYQSIYGGFMDAQRMVRQGGWKLIVYPELDVHLLYNLNADPQETRNLASQPQFASRKRQLFAELQRWQQKLDDPVELSLDDP